MFPLTIEPKLSSVTFVAEKNTNLALWWELRCLPLIPAFGSRRSRSPSAMQLSLMITWATLNPDSVPKGERQDGDRKCKLATGYIMRPWFESLKRKKAAPRHGDLQPLEAEVKGLLVVQGQPELETLSYGAKLFQKTKMGWRWLSS